MIYPYVPSAYKKLYFAGRNVILGNEVLKLFDLCALFVDLLVQYFVFFLEF